MSEAFSISFILFFFNLLYSLIKLYYIKALSDPASSLDPDQILILQRPRTPTSLRDSATSFQYQLPGAAISTDMGLQAKEIQPLTFPRPGLGTQVPAGLFPPGDSGRPCSSLASSSRDHAHRSLAATSCHHYTVSSLAVFPVGTPVLGLTADPCNQDHLISGSSMLSPLQRPRFQERGPGGSIFGAGTIQPSIGSGQVYSFPEKQPCPDHTHVCSADQHLGDAGSWTAPPVRSQTRGGGVVYDANAFSPGPRKEFLRAVLHKHDWSKIRAKKVGGVGGVSRVHDPVR